MGCQKLCRFHFLSFPCVCWSIVLSNDAIKTKETIFKIFKYLLLKAKGVAVLSTEMSLVGKWQMEHLSTEIENKTGK